MKKKIKFSLIGCSTISDKHLKAIDSLSDTCSLVDVCDVDKKKSNEIAHAYNVSAFYSLDELIAKSNSDCIIITTPSGLHAEQSIRALQSGFSVLSEKPMAINLKDSKKMLKISNSSENFLFIVKQLRFIEPIQKIKKIIDDERLGRLFSLTVNIFINRSEEYFNNSWKGTKKMDGGALYNQASHFIDLFIWLFGDIEALSAFNSTLERNIETEDSSVVNFKFNSGALGTLNTSILAFQKNLENSITILGEKGTIKISGKFLNKVEEWLLADEKEDDFKKGQELNYEISHVPIYKNIINTFEGKEKPFIGSNEAIKSIKFIEACHESQRKKKIISLTDDLS